VFQTPRSSMYTFCLPKNMSERERGMMGDFMSGSKISPCGSSWITQTIDFFEDFVNFFCVTESTGIDQLSSIQYKMLSSEDPE